MPETLPLPQRPPILVWIFLETLSIADLERFPDGSLTRTALISTWRALRRRPHEDKAADRASAALQTLDQARVREESHA